MKFVATKWERQENAAGTSVYATGAGAGGGGTASQGRFLQLAGEAAAHFVHDGKHLIKGDKLTYAA